MYGGDRGSRVEVVIDVVAAEVKVEVQVQVEVPCIPSSTLRLGLMFLSGLCSMRTMKSSVLRNNSYFRVIDTPNNLNSSDSRVVR